LIILPDCDHRGDAAEPYETEQLHGGRFCSPTTAKANEEAVLKASVARFDAFGSLAKLLLEEFPGRN
jgi:hypothetical protein